MPPSFIKTEMKINISFFSLFLVVVVVVLSISSSRSYVKLLFYTFSLFQFNNRFSSDGSVRSKAIILQWLTLPTEARVTRRKIRCTTNRKIQKHLK